MTLSLHIQIATAEALMRHHDPPRIHGCCATCPDYGHYWSCPPFGEDPLSRFPVWDHAVLVFDKVWTAPGATRERMIEGFHAARKPFRSLLLAVERQHPGTTALVAGYCQACENCSRPGGGLCRVPSVLRYSLEAVGFDVTGLAEGLAGQRLLWPREGLPDYLLTVGAVLCAGRDCAERLGQGMIELRAEQSREARP